jgi:hypothetical protein
MKRMSDGPICALQRFKGHCEYASILKIRIFNIVGKKRQKTTRAVAGCKLTITHVIQPLKDSGGMVISCKSAVNDAARQ